MNFGFNELSDHTFVLYSKVTFTFFPFSTFVSSSLMYTTIPFPLYAAVKVADIVPSSLSVIAALLSFGIADFHSLGVEDADVKYAQDALSAEAYVKWSASDIENIKKDTMDIMLQAKVGYNVSGGTVYVKFVDKDVLDFLKKSNLDTLELGFDGYMGAMSYNIAAKVSSSWAGKINFSVPFWVRLGF